MVGVADKLAAAAKIRAESGGKELSTDQKSRMMDIWATHPGPATLQRGEKKPTTNYKKGGMVKGQCRDYSK